MIDKNAVWLVTGCSSGLGSAIARQALQAGYRVVVTARDTTTVAELIGAYPQTAHAVSLDVTDLIQVQAAVARAEDRFGSLDVLVNNAGYGYLGAIEEGEEEDVRDMFETDVFGLWQMVKAALPGMRARGRGHVVNISSIGGLTTFAGVGFYHMAKFAVEALSETLAKEVAGFEIGVTVVEPGAFRTDFRGRSMKQSKIRLAAYDQTAGKGRDGVLAGHGKQNGDPVRGARAIIAALEAPQSPLHLVIGGDALDLARRKLIELAGDFDAWETVSRGTDFEACGRPG